MSLLHVFHPCDISPFVLQWNLLKDKGKERAFKQNTWFYLVGIRTEIFVGLSENSIFVWLPIAISFDFTQ